MWTPFGLPWLRIGVAVVGLGALVAGPLIAAQYEVPEALLTVVLAVLLTFGYVAAYVGTSHARRGDIPDWRWLTRSSRIPRSLPRLRRTFASSARAQLWFEWRRHGLSLPVMVSAVIPFALVLLFVFDQDRPEGILSTLAGTLLLPPFLAGTAATMLSKSNPHVNEYYGVSSFTATRPMTSAALVAAKLKMAALSTFIAWLLVVLLTPLALWLSGNWPVVGGCARQWFQEQPPLKAGAALVLVAAALLGLTWKRLVENLYIGLTGSQWIIKGGVILTMTGFIVLCFMGKWVYDHPEYHAPLLDMLPWCAGTAIGLKLLAAAWVCRTLQRRRLLGIRAIRALVGGWSLIAICFFALLVECIPAGIVPTHLLDFGIILAVPFARLAAAPMALAWNRHR
jgi:hypothetical protein